MTSNYEVFKKMIFWAVAGFAAYSMWLTSQQNQQGVKIKGTARRNVQQQPMLLDVFRSLGRVLSMQGYEEQELQKFHPDYFSMPQLKEKFVQKFDGSPKLLEGVYLQGRTDILKRQQFKGPSDEISQPQGMMLSPWYNAATVGRRPYVTRVVPPGTVPL